MFVINFSPNAVIPDADLAQLSGLGGEGGGVLSSPSQRKGRGARDSAPASWVSQVTSFGAPSTISPVGSLPSDNAVASSAAPSWHLPFLPLPLRVTA